MIEITVNDRLGKKVRVKCNEDDTIGDLKKLIAAQTGTRFVFKKKLIFREILGSLDIFTKIFFDPLPLPDIFLHTYPAI